MNDGDMLETIEAAIDPDVPACISPAIRSSPDTTPRDGRTTSYGRWRATWSSRSVQASKRIAENILDGKVARGEDARRRNRTGARLSFAREGPRAFAEKRAPVWQAT